MVHFALTSFLQNIRANQDTHTSTGCFKVRSDCKLYSAKNIQCFFRQMKSDSGKKFIYKKTFQSNFKLKFEEIIIFLMFCPKCA